MNKKAFIGISAIILAGAVLVAGSFAILSDRTSLSLKTNISSNPLSITLSDISLKCNNISVEDTAIMAPGDILSMNWQVNNEGTKSVSTRNTVYIWNDDINVSEFFKLYSDTISNEDILAEYDSKEFSNKEIETSTFEIDSKSHTGYKFIINGDILDGVGENSETGYAMEGPNICSVEDTEDTIDYLGYKLALNKDANFLTQNKKINICIVTEAIQTMNTDNSSWETVAVNNIVTQTT